MSARRSLGGLRAGSCAVALRRWGELTPARDVIVPVQDVAGDDGDTVVLPLAVIAAAGLGDEPLVEVRIVGSDDVPPASAVRFRPLHDGFLEAAAAAGAAATVRAVLSRVAVAVAGAVVRASLPGPDGIDHEHAMEVVECDPARGGRICGFGSPGAPTAASFAFSQDDVARAAGRGDGGAGWHTDDGAAPAPGSHRLGGGRPSTASSSRRERRAAPRAPAERRASPVDPGAAARGGRPGTPPRGRAAAGAGSSAIGRLRGLRTARSARTGPVLALPGVDPFGAEVEGATTGLARPSSGLRAPSAVRAAPAPAQPSAAAVATVAATGRAGEGVPGGGGTPGAERGPGPAARRPGSAKGRRLSDGVLVDFPLPVDVTAGAPGAARPPPERPGSAFGGHGRRVGEPRPHSPVLVSPKRRSRERGGFA